MITETNRLNTSRPKVAVDTVLLTVTNQTLEVLLVKINQGLYAEKWAVPGGLVKINENLDEAAKRILFQKTNIGNIHLEQLYTFGEVERDLRDRSISVAYFALIPQKSNYKLKTSTYYSRIAWWPVNKIPSMAFDHRGIVNYAVLRLRNKIQYTNIAYSLLPPEFTFTKLQETYEVILGEKIDKRNFRKKIIALGLIKETGKVLKGEPHRPAVLYQFTKKDLISV
jgi:8-oxo-dGTP diphosphatase